MAVEKESRNVEGERASKGRSIETTPTPIGEAANKREGTGREGKGRKKRKEMGGKKKKKNEKLTWLNFLLASAPQQLHETENRKHTAATGVFVVPVVFCQQ